MDTQNFTAKLPAQVRKLGYYIDGAAREAGDRKTLVREAPGYRSEPQSHEGNQSRCSAGWSPMGTCRASMSPPRFPPVSPPRFDA